MFGTRQRGAIGIMAAVTLLLGLICLVLVVDTGRLYLEQRKLQRVADMAALETATQSGMCGTQSSAALLALARASAQRNGFPSDGTLSAALGDVGFDGSGQLRLFSAGNTTWNDSVKVVVTRSVASSIILNAAAVFGAKTPTRVTLTAQAVARRAAMAGLSAGAGLARVNTANSPLLNPLLGALLGTNLSLSVATYEGLAGANISLLSLGQQLQAAGVSLNLGSVDSLLGANVSVAQLINAMVNAADASQVAGVDASLLRTALATIKVPTAQLSLGQILSVIAPDSARDAALGADVNLGDLLMATAMVANKNHAVSIPGLTVGIAGTTATIQLTVISPPTIAIGYPGKDGSGNWRTVARNAQVNLVLTADSNLLNLNLVNAHIVLSLTAFQGSAALASIQCAGPGQDATVGVAAAPGIASLGLNVTAGVIGIGGNYLANATVTSSPASMNIAAPGEQPLSFDIGKLPSDVQTAQSPLGTSLAAGVASLGKNLKVDVSLGGLLCNLPLVSWLTCGLSSVVNSLLSSVVSSVANLEAILTTALSNVLGALASVLIDPLLQLLGIQTGILDVRIIDLQSAGAELLI
ncbi:pilus assembly protein TadG-related protein [Pseudomonas citronellolis]|uniref:pilus assembly protein TadG-related protein n=1 Tax=Pseudomonas citronellolis TaxID=53408 RepID=UPI0023E3BFA6|nr:pilus assembly protein TadG-related protein [Pseudomonas citronellolis]MDF3932650.1 pilus assembly protein TadG-related protein [Pseudomonas citronellolis]